MTTSTEAAPTCRCGAALALLGSSKHVWVDEHIGWLCGDGKPHAPVAADRWQELKAYLDANASDPEAEAYSADSVTGVRLRARAKTFALVRQYMDEMEATADVAATVSPATEEG